MQDAERGMHLTHSIHSPFPNPQPCRTFIHQNFDTFPNSPTNSKRYARLLCRTVQNFYTKSSYKLLRTIMLNACVSLTRTHSHSTGTANALSNKQATRCSDAGRRDDTLGARSLTLLSRDEPRRGYGERPVSNAAAYASR